MAAKRPSPVQDASWKELKREVRVAIARLPEAQRVVVRMRYFEGKTFKEIACTLGEFDEH